MDAESGHYRPLLGGGRTIMILKGNQRGGSGQLAANQGHISFSGIAEYRGRHKIRYRVYSRK